MFSTNENRTSKTSEHELTNATTGHSTAAESNATSTAQDAQPNPNSTPMDLKKGAEKVESDSVRSSLAAEIREKAKELDDKEQSLTQFHNLLRRKHEDQYSRETAIVAREEAVGLFSGRFIQGEKKKSKLRKAKKTRATKHGPFTAGEIFPVKLESGPEADRKIEGKKIALRERKQNEALISHSVAAESSQVEGGQISGIHEVDSVPEGLERLKKWMKSELGEPESDNQPADTNSAIIGDDLTKLTKEKLAEVFKWFLAQKGKALREYEKEVEKYNQLVVANERNIVERETAVGKLEETAARIQAGEEGSAGGSLMDDHDVDAFGPEDKGDIPNNAMEKLRLLDEAE